LIERVRNALEKNFPDQLQDHLRLVFVGTRCQSAVSQDAGPLLRAIPGKSLFWRTIHEVGIPRRADMKPHEFPKACLKTRHWLHRYVQGSAREGNGP